MPRKKILTREHLNVEPYSVTKFYRINFTTLEIEYCAILFRHRAQSNKSGVLWTLFVGQFSTYSFCVFLLYGGFFSVHSIHWCASRFYSFLTLRKCPTNVNVSISYPFALWVCIKTKPKKSSKIAFNNVAISSFYNTFICSV